jgi:enoyl-CoA hydratase/carnithine racemase
MPGEIGTYLGLTGARVNAADMIYAGAATHFVSSTELSTVTGRLAAGESADTVLQSLKQDVGVAPLAQYRESIDTAFSADSVEGIISRLNRAGPFGAGAEKILSTCSPTSLKLVLRQLREGRARDLDDCLRMEFRIVAQILKGHDFFEGVRAVLIDKDNAPRWRPPRLDLVSDAEIEAFFAPSSATLEL